MKDLHESWGRKVKQRRLALGLTQEQVANLAKIDQGKLSRIERGKCPTDDEKFRLAAALSASPDLLFPYPPVIPPLPQAVGQ